MRSWSAAAPRVYDLLMAPIEALGMERMRAALWSAVPRGGAGLEIGAGSGASARMRPRSANVVGADLSPGMLARARGHRDDAPLVAADVQQLPFRAHSFDWVAASLLFCEVPDPARGLAEVRRVLRPDGTLHLLEHVRPDGLPGVIAEGVSRLTGPLFGEHFDRRTAATVAAAGFTIERLERRLRGGLIHLIARRTDNARTDDARGTDNAERDR